MIRDVLSLLPFTWFMSVVSKAIYVFIGLNRYRDAPIPGDWAPLHLPLFVIGMLSTSLGVLLIRKLHGNPGFLSLPFLNGLGSRAGQGGLQGKMAVFFNLYFIGLGLGETCALFGLAGFITKGNLPFFIAMIAVSLTGWAVNYPRMAIIREIQAAGRDQPRIDTN